MKVGDKQYQSIWLNADDNRIINIIDQRLLPFEFKILSLETVEDVFYAIRDMALRGAPLIGVAGAFGMYLAALEISNRSNPADHLKNAARYLSSSRPTAVNLDWALKKQLELVGRDDSKEMLVKKLLENARNICAEEIEKCRLIGESGLPVIEKISRQKKEETVNILTHCNAGWLACVDYGTATAPIYLAHDRGIKLHVWVDETRPRNQGARLTAFELGEHGVPHTLITDNAGGYLMKKGMVDLVLVGSDRTGSQGDVANKTGTYLKALAAKDNNIPFYVALPTSSIDRSIINAEDEIEIEERDPEEVSHTEGYLEGKIVKVSLCPEQTKISNFGFDITPAHLVSGLISEKGIVKASKEGINSLFTE